MSALKDAQALVKTLKKQTDSKDPTPALETLSQLKVCMTQFSNLPPATQISKESGAERTLAMQAYEAAVVLSVKLERLDLVERNFQQLRPFYFEYAQELGASKNREEYLGLELLALLVESRLAEFYSLLEMIGSKEKASKPIKFVVSLEQFLMDGSYNKVLAARKDSPSKLYLWLLSLLENTVRDEVANCLEAAYPQLSLVSE
jgi:26S proteasome regulatory subunit N12